MDTVTATNRYRAIIDGMDAEAIDNGLAWYPSMTATIREWADMACMDIIVAAHVTAALSQRKRWADGPNSDGNRTLAMWTIANGSLPDTIRGGLLPAVRCKVAAILAGESLCTGQKTAAFAANLAGDYSRATIDTWMMRAAGIDRNAPSTSEYRMLEEACAIIAAERGWTVAATQAVIWIGITGYGHATE